MLCWSLGGERHSSLSVYLNSVICCSFTLQLFCYTLNPVTLPPQPCYFAPSIVTLSPQPCYFAPSTLLLCPLNPVTLPPQPCSIASSTSFLHISVFVAYPLFHEVSWPLPLTSPYRSHDMCDQFMGWLVTMLMTLYHVGPGEIEQGCSSL